MATQSEAALEEGLIKTLIDNSYERVYIKEEENLKENFKIQLEKHNAKELSAHGRTCFTEKEFDRIMLYLEGGTRFEKAKKLRDIYPLETEDGDHIWVQFLNQQKWCTYDEAKTKADSVEIALQIMGKVRARIVVPADISKEDVLAAAKANPVIAAAIAGKQIKKEIYVPGKLVNIVAV